MPVTQRFRMNLRSPDSTMKQTSPLFITCLLVLAFSGVVVSAIAQGRRATPQACSLLRSSPEGADYFREYAAPSGLKLYTTVNLGRCPRLI
jgi:hypothetical protein